MPEEILKKVGVSVNVLKCRTLCDMTLCIVINLGANSVAVANMMESSFMWIISFLFQKVEKL